MSKVWFVTGAARGIGAQVVKAALSVGDRVVATGRDLQALDKAHFGYGERLLKLALDVADDAQAQRATAAAVAHFGRIDVLVNNAGYGQLGLFEENTPDEIERQFSTNVYGTFNVTRAVLPVMRRQRSGHIFNVSAMGGVLGFPAGSIFCASKFAVEGFSESLALEVGQFGIHVTIVEPGFTRTDFLDGSSVRYGARRIADYARYSGEVRSAYEEMNHLQAGDPARLALALLKLACDPRAPLRFASGSDAIDLILDKLDTHESEVRRWESLSMSVDQPVPTARAA